MHPSSWLRNRSFRLTCAVALVTLSWGASAEPCSANAVVRPASYGASHPFAKSWTETVLLGFGGQDGAYPYSPLIDVKGTLYGTADNGGASAPPHNALSSGGFTGWGAVYAMVPHGKTYVEAVVYSFTGGPGDGANPFAGLVADASGALYGTTLDGGAKGYGTVFKLAPSGSTYTESILHSFTGSPDGASPYGSLVVDASGAVYGTTAQGGSKQCTGGCGAVFKLTPGASGYTETIVRAFKAHNDGLYPYANVTLGPGGVIFGTTYFGGSAGNGTVFKLTPSGASYTETLIYSFAGGTTDGTFPQSGVTLAKNGVLYGTTSGGGNPACTGGCGMVYALTPSGSSYVETIVHAFAAGSDGFFPYAGIALGAGGKLYGTTYYGGSGCSPTGCGTVYLLAPSGSTYAETTYDFSGGTDGELPNAAPLLEGRDLLGTTYSGGGGACFQDQSACGAVWEIKL